MLNWGPRWTYPNRNRFRTDGEDNVRRVRCGDRFSSALNDGQHRPEARWTRFACQRSWCPITLKGDAHAFQSCSHAASKAGGSTEAEQFQPVEFPLECDHDGGVPPCSTLYVPEWSLWGAPDILSNPCVADLPHHPLKVFQCIRADGSLGESKTRAG